MHIVLCLDDRNGMLFNGRRLSSDQVVCHRIFERHSGNLMMSNYSAKLFNNMEIVADDRFLCTATAADTCFVEDLTFMDNLPAVTSITIYRWNRHYPSDIKLPEQLLEGWNLTQKIELIGSSHDTVTEEIYTR